MKKCRFFILFSALIMSFSFMTACVSENSAGSELPQEKVSQSTKLEESSKAEEPNSSVSESSDTESSNITESSADEPSEIETYSSENSNNESSDETSKEASVEESSTDNSDGYYFDDEQIVKDYHTATEFTSNKEFNALFINNHIDAEFKSELRDALSISEMRTTTMYYANIWKDEVQIVYDKLYDLLSDNDEARTSLEESQQDWNIGRGGIEEKFYEEAKESGVGSEALLSADTAIMNYYKGRAAILYEQIYRLTGKFEMQS